MKKTLTPAQQKLRQMSPTTVYGRRPTAAPLPPQASRQMAPGGDRPMGVAPAPRPNPIPMSPAEATSRAKTQAMRGTMTSGPVGVPDATQPGFRSGLTPTAMAEGGKVRKSKPKAKRK